VAQAANKTPAQVNLCPAVGMCPAYQALKRQHNFLSSKSVIHVLLAMQVLIQWSLQSRCIVIPKSTNPKHIEEWGVGDDPFELDESAMQALEEVGRTERHRYLWDPTDVA